MLHRYSALGSGPQIRAWQSLSLFQLLTRVESDILAILLGLIDEGNHSDRASEWCFVTWPPSYAGEKE